VNLNVVMENPQYLFYAVVGLCMVVLSICFVFLISAIRSTLKRVNRSLDVVDERVRQLAPVLDGVSKVEENLNEMLSDIQIYIERLQKDASRVMSEAAEALERLRQIETSVEQRLDDDVPPILKETKELVSGVNEITNDVQTKIRAADELFEAIDEAGKTVRMVTGIVRGGFTGLAVQLASLAVGMKASIEYVTENMQKGGEDK